MHGEDAGSVSATDPLPGSNQILGISRSSHPCQVAKGVDKHNRARGNAEWLDGLQENVCKVGKRAVLEAKDVEAPVGSEAGKDWSAKTKTAGEV